MSKQKPCTKIRYRDREQANNALHSVQSTDREKVPVRHYFCSRCCGYHLTSESPNAPQVVADLTLDTEKEIKTMDKVICDTHGVRWQDRHEQTSECVNPQKPDPFDAFSDKPRVLAPKPAEPVVLAATAQVEGGHQGVITENGSIIWRCDHGHAGRLVNGRIPAGSSYDEHPEQISAKTCALNELRRRESGSRLRVIECGDCGVVLAEYQEGLPRPEVSHTCSKQIARNQRVA